MIKDALLALKKAERPVLIFGAGVRLAQAVDEARALALLLGIPVAVTWGACDLFPADGSGRCVGGFGTHGTRAANFTVQNADWIVAVGTRLDSKATGTPRAYFAREADIFMADIDPAEVRKFGGVLGKTFTGVQADAKMFLGDMVSLARGEEWPGFDSWRRRCVEWMTFYPTCPQEYTRDGLVNPYALVQRLSEACRSNEVIVSDTGLSLAWLMQAFEFKDGQQFVHALNQTPMGYGLPAAIGAAYARPGQRVVLVTGDGGLMLNLQELSVVAGFNLPIKIILFNNGGHVMCQQTQDQWLGGRYYSTSPEHGLCFPEFNVVARAFGLRDAVAIYNQDVGPALEWLFLTTEDQPALLNVSISGHHRLVPQVPYGRPNEDGNPLLPRDEFREQMIVEVVDV